MVLEGGIKSRDLRQLQSSGGTGEGTCYLLVTEPNWASLTGHADGKTAGATS
jgi:hypothetical protein